MGSLRMKSIFASLLWNRTTRRLLLQIYSQHISEKIEWPVFVQSYHVLIPLDFSPREMWIVHFYLFCFPHWLLWYHGFCWHNDNIVWEINQKHGDRKVLNKIPRNLNLKLDSKLNELNWFGPWSSLKAFNKIISLGYKSLPIM